MKSGSAVERALGHRFGDAALLERALTHRSYASANNERLEFLGDALVNLVIAEALYRQLPRAEEGALSRLRSSLVREETLAQLGREMPLGDNLRLGEGELRSGGWRRDSVLADTFEALVAAVYLDAGFEAARDTVLKLFAPLLLALPDPESLKDSKTRLQEWLQGQGRPLPSYALVSESGPPHRRVFLARCQLNDAAQSTEASGLSRRGAEQDAARNMLNNLMEQN